MSELAGTIWRWAAIAALVAVGAIAVITLSFDDDAPAPPTGPAAQEGAGAGPGGGCTEVERLLAAAALLPDDECRTRRATNVAPRDALAGAKDAPR